MRSTGTIAMSPIQWATLPDIEDVPPITETDYAVLREIRDVLARHGALKRFGINLLHRHFDLEPDEILVEYTDVENRTLVSRVETNAVFQNETHAIETNWAFDRDGASVVCRGGCVYNRGHRRQHV